MKRLLLLTTAFAFSTLAQAEFTFDSGSTGVDGAYNPDCPTPDFPITLDVGASGIMNFTTINIGENCIVRFTPTGNSDTTKSNPVVFLAQGDVVIDGQIYLDSGVSGVGGLEAMIRALPKSAAFITPGVGGLKLTKTRHLLQSVLIGGNRFWWGRRRVARVIIIMVRY